MAKGLGADVTILDIDLERLRFLDIAMDNLHTPYSNEANLDELMAGCDLLIGAVLLPGAKAPKLITRAMLRKMKPGSVLVDISIDQGGARKLREPPPMSTRFTWKKMSHTTVWPTCRAAYARARRHRP